MVKTKSQRHRGNKYQNEVKYLGITIGFNKNMMKKQVKQLIRSRIINTTCKFHKASAKVKSEISCKMVDSIIRYYLKPL